MRKDTIVVLALLVIAATFALLASDAFYWVLGIPNVHLTDLPDAETFSFVRSQEALVIDVTLFTAAAIIGVFQGLRGGRSRRIPHPFWWAGSAAVLISALTGYNGITSYYVGDLSIIATPVAYGAAAWWFEKLGSQLRQGLDSGRKAPAGSIPPPPPPI